MKSKEWTECDECSKRTKSIRFRDGKYLCYHCWIKEMEMIYFRFCKIPAKAGLEKVRIDR